MRGRLLARGPDKRPGQATVDVLIDREHGLGLGAVALDDHLERFETGEGRIDRCGADPFR